MAQVIEQAIADLLRQRRDEFLSPLARWKANTILSPVDVCKLKGSNLTATHSIVVEHLYDGEVTPTFRSRTVDAFHGFQCIRLRDPARCHGQLVAPYARYRYTQITVQVSFLKTESKE